MNVDTGEIRKMTAEEADELNRSEGREVWVHLMGNTAMALAVAAPVASGGHPLSRRERRAAERKRAKQTA